jgi:uncharacterized protein YchJ
MDGLLCPCGYGDEYESCCGRFHAGTPAPTAESLMRSRYSAFAVGDTAYLLRTWHPSARPPTLSLDPDLVWTRRRDEQVRPARQALDLSRSPSLTTITEVIEMPYLRGADA